MEYDKWLEEVKKLCGENWEYYNEWYSFNTAYFVNKMTPEKAVKDCDGWMNCN